MSTIKKIAWEKWHNPFGDDDGHLERFKDICQLDDDDNTSSTYQDNYEDDEDNKGISITETDQVKVMSTPMGIVPITEHTDISKIFNFWTGHANFNLSDKVVRLIDRVDGIETLDVFTRYRMRIGIGKHPSFKVSDIINKINIIVSGIVVE